MGLTTKAWKFVLVLGLCLVTGYLLVPAGSARDVLYLVVGTGSVVCVLVGIHIHRPNDPLGWYLLALGLAATSVGDVLTLVRGLHPTPPGPTLRRAMRCTWPATRASSGRSCGSGEIPTRPGGARTTPMRRSSPSAHWPSRGISSWPPMPPATR